MGNSKLGGQQAVWTKLSLANSVYENPSLPRRKLLLSTGGANYRPPLERSKSAPKLSAIEEDAVAEEIEQQRFLEELRSFEREACCWDDQESWRLARLLEALQQYQESSDENGSISSGCETASTANSEERVSSSEDSHLPVEQDLISGQRTSGNALTAAMTPQPVAPRRNSEGSQNFMTLTSSPRFRRRNCRSSRTRSRSTFSLLRSVDQDNEDTSSSSAQEMTTLATTLSTTTTSTMSGGGVVVGAGGASVNCNSNVVAAVSNDNFFDFEDPEDLDEIVDFRPHGESREPQSPSRLQNDSYAALMARRDDVLKMMTSRLGGCTSCDELDSPAEKAAPTGIAPILAQTANQATLIALNVVPTVLTLAVNSNHHKLGSLHEEEVDSDESGYVEASPKSSIDRGSLPAADKKLKQQQQEVQQQKNETNNNNNNNNHNNNNNEPNEDEPAEFIKCPISETIKKLANASLRSSKATRVSQTSPLRLETLNRVNRTSDVEVAVEPTPSLLQRKRLLAQRGVTV